MTEAYLYKDWEVRKTGRKAGPDMVSEPNRRIPKSRVPSSPVKYEIRPVDPSLTWTKWVSLHELYEIDDSEVVELGEKHEIANVQTNYDDVIDRVRSHWNDNSCDNT